MKKKTPQAVLFDVLNGASNWRREWPASSTLYIGKTRLLIDRRDPPKSRKKENGLEISYSIKGHSYVATIGESAVNAVEIK